MVGATPFGRDMLFDVPPELAQELQATGKAGSKFKIVNGVVKGRAPSCWFTDLDHQKRHEPLPLYRKYPPDELREAFLDYRLSVYVCTGTDLERLDWFRTINIAGEELKPQELRNAVYSGPWVSDARKWFSQQGGPATGIGGDYLSGSAIHQDYLETAIEWVSDGNVEDYMARHQSDPDASELWDHFESVLEWVRSTFTEYRKPMKGVDWGRLYADHGSRTDLDPAELEKRTEKLFDNEDVTREKGIYAYLLDGDERHLSIRAFPKQVKQRVFKKQKGRCASCGDRLEFTAAHADHRIPWSKGGHTVEDNCQVLCVTCNLAKSDH